MAQKIETNGILTKTFVEGGSSVTSSSRLIFCYTMAGWF